MTAREVLETAKALIDKPQKWCRGSYKKNGRYCAVGALIVAVDYGLSRVQAECALDRVVGTHITVFNDTHSHAELMAAFDRAIEAS